MEEHESFSFWESEPSWLDMSVTYYRKESKKKAKTKFVYLGVFLSVIVIIEYFTRSHMQLFSNFLFGSTDPMRCKTWNYFDFYSFSGKYFLLFWVYSYANLYAALGFIFLDSFSWALNGIIRYFYLQPRPFWDNPSLVPCFCATDYSNPSATGTNIFILFASFFHIFTYKSKSIHKKISWGIFCSFCIVLICLIPLLENVDYLNQTLFGIGLGVCIHYWFYDIVKVNYSNRKQFRQIINQPIIVTALTISVWGLINLIHFNTNFRINPIYIVNIQKYCTINDVFSLNRESITKSIQLFEFFGCYLGIWLEYKVTFKSNLGLFARYNIKNKFSELYNDTGSLTSLLRFLVLYFSQVGVFSRLILNKKDVVSSEENIIWVLFTMYWLPMFVQGIFYFYIMKRGLALIGLTNERISFFNDNEHSKNVQEDY